MKLLTGCLALLFATISTAQKPSVPVITDNTPTAFALGQAEHEIDLGNQFTTTWIAWRWDHGYFVKAQFHASPRTSAVTLFDRDGIFVRDITVWFEDARNVSVMDAAVAPNGNVIVSGSADYDHPVKGSFRSEFFDANLFFFLAEYDHSGRMVNLLPTSRYASTKICTDADSTVWTWGNEHPVFGRTTGPFEPALRQYDLSHGLLFDSAKQMTFPNFNPNAKNPSSNGAEMVCGADFVGLYDGLHLRWIEYDRKSGITSARRVAMLGSPETGYHESLNSLTATSSGDVYGGIHRSSNIRIYKPMYAIYRLDRSSSDVVRWKRVSGASGTLMGSDGDALIHMEPSLPLYHVVWSKPVPATEIAAK